MLRHVYLPAGAYTKFLLDLSVGSAGQSNVTAALDLGDNGSIDWRTPAAGPGPARWTTGDLATALNTLLAGKAGTVDVPLRIYVSPSGSATLNGYTSAVVSQADLAPAPITVSPTAAAASDISSASTSATAAREGDTLYIATTLRNNGTGASGPLTAAFFAAVPNWGDWYLGSAYVSNLASGASAPAAVDWNTMNFGGVTAVKVVVNPYGTTDETNLANNTVTLPVTVVPLHPAPVVDFSATPVAGGAPLSVRFTDLTSGDVTARNWQFGDGSSSTVANPAHTYTAMGAYTVTLSAEGPGGSDWERKTAFITVTDEPVAPAAAFNATPTSGTVPLTVQFTDQSSGTITSRQWDFGDGQTSTQQNPSHTFTSPGSYAVTLNVNGPGGANSKQMPAYITVTPPAPVAGFSASPTLGVAPLNVQFSDASGGSITGRTWNFGDGATSNAQSPLHSYIAAGVYDVTLTVSGPGGSDTEYKAGFVTVTVVPPPSAPVAAFSAGPTSGTVPLTVQFSDTSSGSITGRTWNFGDGTTSTAQSPSHSYTAAGIYDVSLIVTGLGGSDTKARAAYITVSGTSPETVMAAFSASPTAGMAPLTVQFSDASTGSIAVRTWDFGDGVTSTAQSPAHSYTAAGVYNVALTVTGPGGSDTETKAAYITVSVISPELMQLYLPTVTR